MTRTFLVKADIGNVTRRAAWPDRDRAGGIAAAAGGVTKLPLSALKEEQGRSTVWLVDRASMTVKLQPVQVAGADGNDAVIGAGLAPGQIVVTAGVHVLNPGQKVKFYVDPGAVASAASASRSRRVAVPERECA